MHVKVLEVAKSYLEKNYNNIQVVGGYLSPSHDSYVQSKLGYNYHISGTHRQVLLSSMKSISTFFKYQTALDRYIYIVTFGIRINMDDSPITCSTLKDTNIYNNT